MDSLSSSVLFKLFREMGVEKKQSVDGREPVLLQIRSIIPLLSEDDDLWPNQGFFLKVSDSSHALYVSLPHEQDNMVLCNELQLGQFIYVKTLEAGYPVPILKGIKLVPGRHPCYGDPEDLNSIDNLESFCGVPEIRMIVEEYNDEKKKPRETIRSISAPKARPNWKKGRRSSSCTREGDEEKKKTRKNRTSDVDNESGSETNTSTVSSGYATRRRNWNGEAIVKIAEYSNSDSVVTKNEIKPIGRITSATVPPIHKYESSDENSISRGPKKDISNAKNSNKSSNQTRTSFSRKSAESLRPAAKPGSSNDKKWTEPEIQWDSLPSNLAKLGKEVLRQRDIALLASVDILLEASAAERLLKCLSAYSELQSSKGNDKQPSVDNFFNFHKDLAQTRLIFQSITSISPVRPTDADSNDHGAIKEMLKIGLDMKKNATSWIKAALASDLSPVPAPSKTKKATSEATSTDKKSSKSSPVGKTKGTCIIRMQRSNGEFQPGLANEKDNQPDWVKGSALRPSTDLAKSLSDECRSWFLAYVENYLDKVKSESILRQSDSQVAEMMRHIKTVNDWLDVIVKRDENKETSTLKDSESEAYQSVKNKIYEILLKHVERTADAFDHMNTIAEV